MLVHEEENACQESRHGHDEKQEQLRCWKMQYVGDEHGAYRAAGSQAAVTRISVVLDHSGNGCEGNSSEVKHAESSADRHVQHVRLQAGAKLPKNKGIDQQMRVVTVHKSMAYYAVPLVVLLDPVRPIQQGLLQVRLTQGLVRDQYRQQQYDQEKTQ